MPGSAAGDDREALLRQRGGEAAGRAVVAVAAADPRGAEDADRGTDLGQRVEALDELAHDPERAPGVGLLESERRLARAEELLVLGAAVARPGATHHDGAAPPLRLLLPTRHQALLVLDTRCPEW